MDDKVARKIKVMDKNGKEEEIDINNFPFPNKWVVALAYTEKVFDRWKDQGQQLTPEQKVKLFVDLISLCP